jgi:hypothetical protein
MTYRVPLTLVTFALVVVGCTSSSEGGSTPTGEDDVVSAKKAEAIVEHAQCAAGNSSHAIKRYDPTAFDAAATKEEIKQRHAEICPGRKYSTSRENGVEMFKSFLAESLDSDVGFVDCEDLPTLERDLINLVGDPTNRGVYAAVRDEAGTDREDSCYISRFYVFRADGTRIDFDFDWAD